MPLIDDLIRRLAQPYCQGIELTSEHFSQLPRQLESLCQAIESSRSLRFLVINQADFAHFSETQIQRFLQCLIKQDYLHAIDLRDLNLSRLPANIFTAIVATLRQAKHIKSFTFIDCDLASLSQDNFIDLIHAIMDRQFGGGFVCHEQDWLDQAQRCILKYEIEKHGSFTYFECNSFSCQVHDRINAGLQNNYRSAALVPSDSYSSGTLYLLGREVARLRLSNVTCDNEQQYVALGKLYIDLLRTSLITDSETASLVFAKWVALNGMSMSSGRASPTFWQAAIVQQPFHLLINTLTAGTLLDKVAPFSNVANCVLSDDGGAAQACLVDQAYFTWERFHHANNQLITQAQATLRHSP